MTDRTWVRVASCDSVPLREGRAVRVAGRELAIFNLGDRFLAIDNRCPHKGGPLGDGIVAGASVVCPLHGWKVGLASGQVERPAGHQACVAAYPVRIAGGAVIVGLPGPEPRRETGDGTDPIGGVCGRSAPVPDERR